MGKCSCTIKNCKYRNSSKVLNQKVTEEKMPPKGCKFCKCSKTGQCFASNAKLHTHKNQEYHKRGNFNKETKDKVERHLLLCHFSLLHLILLQYLQFLPLSTQFCVVYQYSLLSKENWPLRNTLSRPQKIDKHGYHL